MFMHESESVIFSCRYKSEAFSRSQAAVAVMQYSTTFQLT